MTSEGERDDDRIARAIAHDGGALEDLLREHGPKVQAGLEVDPRWRPDIEPEDVMQVSYLEAFLRIPSLRATTGAGFRAWLSQVAENNLRDAVRALQRDKRPEGRRAVARTGDSSTETLMASLVGPDPTAGSVAAGREAVRRLQAAIAGLPPSYRRVVREVDLAERSVAEVGAMLGKKPGAVHMLRARAHDRLREVLGQGVAFPRDSE